MEKNSYDIPPPAKRNAESPELPFVFIGNETFNLTTSLLTPYQSSNDLDIYKQMFNQNLYQMQKCADNAFDILISRWQIFQKKFSTNPKNTMRIIQAAVCLHNFLMIKDLEKPVEQRQYVLPNGQLDYEKITGCQALYCSESKATPIAESTRNMFQELIGRDNTVILEWA